MSKERRFALGVWAFGKTGDRFVLSGYKESRPVEECIELAAKVPGIKGVEINYPSQLTDQNIERIRRALKDNGLEVAAVGADLSCSAEWAFGSLSALSREVRDKAISIGKRTVEIAAELGASVANFWLGQDGYDYPFQADYPAAWDLLVSGLRECASVRGDVRVSLEYKPREPRNHCFIATAGKALCLANEIGLENVGVTIDVGHALYAYEDVAESAALLARHKKLFHMHFNDNYRFWDDDMMVGSVHFIEYLELIYWLDRLNYEGWYSLDLFPYREDSLKTCTESIEFLNGLSNLIERIGKGQIAAHIQRGDAVGLLSMVRKYTLPDSDR